MRDSYQHFNCGSFPSTIGAQKSKYFTFLNFKANFVDRFKIVKSFGQIVDFYDVFFIPHFANSIKASSILAWVTSTVTLSNPADFRRFFNSSSLKASLLLVYLINFTIRTSIYV